MDTKEKIFTSRRGFIYTFSGLLSAVLLASPKRLFARKPQIKNLIGNLEIELLEKSKPTRDPSITWNSYGDRTKLFMETKGEARPMCAMNQVGEMIWEACTGENTPQNIAQQIHKKYQVSSDQAYVDCLGFLARLKSVGAVRL
jgi:hypothetical protein